LNVHAYFAAIDEDILAYGGVYGRKTMEGRIAETETWHTNAPCNRPRRRSAAPGPQHPPGCVEAPGAIAGPERGGAEDYGKDREAAVNTPR
jgi:hypothetical protein